MRTTGGEPTQRVRLLVADPHRPVRLALERSLANGTGIEVVAAVASGVEVIEAHMRLEPDVVLMELALPRVSGREATRRIIAERPRARIVIHTALSDRRHILAALDAGAIGYLIKGASVPALIAGVRSAARGGSPLAAEAAALLVAERRRRRPEAALTPREREVLILLAEGLPNKVIGAQLQISEKTVKVHVTRILTTLRVTDRTQAALWARDHGLSG